MRHSSRSTSSFGRKARVSLLLAIGGGLLSLAAPGRGDMAFMSQSIWKMKYGVSETQLGSSSWLAADDDGDGIKNQDELASGTNPFSPSNTINVATITLSPSVDPTSVTLEFPTEDGKRYRAESTTTFSSPTPTWTLQPQPSPTVVVGNGAKKTITIPYVADSYYRIRVDDIDQDGDGVSDWAEKVAGFDPTKAMSDGHTPDGTALSTDLASFNVVTVTVSKPSATQPASASTPPVDVGSIIVSRGVVKLGSLSAPNISVPLTTSGTAVAGTAPGTGDYDALPAVVNFNSPKTGSVAYTINPRYNSSRQTNVTAIVKASAGTGYILGSSSSAAVVINPAGIANGTGLTANYYNTSSANYSSGAAPLQTTIFAAPSSQLTRVDPVIDFGTATNTIVSSISATSPCVVTTTRATALVTGDTVTIAGVTGGTFSTPINASFVITATDSTHFTLTSGGNAVNCTVVPTSVVSATIATAATTATGWGVAAGPRDINPDSTTGAFSVRWTGQILPKYSETYNIDFRSDDGAKVWVNGQLLIDRWFAQGATDYVNTIPLQAGVLYDIQIDYFNSATGSAEAKLYWWSASQTREIIPQNRLFPAPAQNTKPTTITSSVAAIGYEGTPFSFSVTSPAIGGTGTTYALALDSGSLPPGLTLNGTTGEISGTPTLAGNYNVAVNATNVNASAVMGSSAVNFTIYPVGGVTREILAANGSAVSDIVIPSPTITPPHDTINTFDDDDNYADNTGERLRGYFIPPKSGNYYFWIAANNAAELWISNDSEYVNRVKRASVTGGSAKKAWNTSTTQRTAWLALVSGQKYYFEVLHNTGTDADDHVAVGWCQDDVGTFPSTSANINAAGTPTALANGGAALQGYPFSGTVPRYVFQPYSYPAVTPPSGTLYACNIGPQANAITSASGSANIQVDAGETQAILHFNYQNLGTPKTAYHLHVDGFTGDDFVIHPQGEIVFDIDDADSNAAEQTGDGGYIWTFGPVGSFTSAAQLREALHKGKVYLNIHSVGYPNGEIRGTFGLIDGSQTPPDASLYTGGNAPTGTDSATNAANAARFLNQATFGATQSEITSVGSLGFAGWLDNQIAMAANLCSHTSNDVVAGLSSDINTPYPSTLFTDSWWKYAITGQDQLRQRLAFALSEIMVVSWANNTGPLQNNGRVLADYVDQLVDYCLPTTGLADSGNFRGILKAVTLTPAMGLYLDMRGNQKADDTIGRHPNENYAREIMQLFSVGIYRMWDDGRFVLGSDAGLVPTYAQPEIIGLANLFTGWNYAQANQGNGRAPSSFGPAADYLNPMVLVPTQHELGAKRLLNNAMSPAATGRTPRVSISSIAPAVPNTNPCAITTSTIHGLKTGDTVTIAGVTGGTFSGGLTAINTNFQATVTSPTAFTVPLSCTARRGAAGTVTGATVTPAAISGTGGITAVTGSQADNSGTGANHPYDLYGLKELDLAIDNIVNNDNVPPYICRQLIQRLVTSDPSPGYIYRVVQKFKNNGSGVRGDMAAVVKQILLDGEARRSSVTQTSTTFGKQREPIMRLTGPARAFPAVPYTGTYSQLPANTINANKLRVVTSAPNDFSSGFTVALNFRGNYTSTVPPTPYNNPTSTNYSIGASLAIASTYLDISSISSGGTPTTITCSLPHGMGAIGQTRTIWFFGLSGTFSDTSINSGGKTATVTGPNTFTVNINTTRAFQVTNVATSATGVACTVTAAAHNLPGPAGTVTAVILNGINGGAFSTSPNTTVNATYVDADTFTIKTTANVAISCSSPPTSYTTWRQCSNPCRVTTQTPHGLSNGDTVTIASVSGGSFSPTINGTYSVSEIDPAAPSSFTLADVSCIAPSTVNTGNIVGGNTLDVNATGMVNVTYTQPAGSNVMTVNTGGPQTDIAIPVPNSATTTLKSKVYLDILTRSSTVAIASIATGNPCTITTATPHGLAGGESVTISGVSGGTFSPSIGSTYIATVVDGTHFTVLSNCTVAPTAATGTVTGSYGTTPADGVYDVQTTTGTSSFTVFTADTPTAARNGNVIVPKISASYTPVSSNNVVQYNCNVNHNLQVGEHIWADIPVVGSPVADAEFIVTAPITGSGILPADEDHFQTSYLPVSSGLGTYSKPSGSNNGATLYPLAPPPMGRSGNVTINQSTFNLGSTESSLTQSPLNSPTVFNFFFPDYKFPGSLANSGLDSPEFQLTTDTNVMNLTNSLTNMFIGTGGGNGNVNGLTSFNNGGGSVVMDIGSYITLVKTSDSGISALIDELATLLIGAPLEANTKTTIQNFVTYKKAITNISQASPCVITAPGHGLVTGNQIAINDVTGGTYSGGSTAINGAWIVTVIDANTFRISTVVTTPVAENCTANGTINYTNANISNFPMNIPNPGPTNLQKRDRVRAIIHLIVTSAEYAVQK